MTPEIKANILLLTKLLDLEMKVENKGVVSLWRWDYVNDKLIRIQ